MSTLVAKSSWIGVEGSIKRGDEFEAMTKDRENELIEAGRASYKPEENKGGSKPENSQKKSVKVEKKTVSPKEDK